MICEAQDLLTVHNGGGGGGMGKRKCELIVKREDWRSMWGSG